MRDNLRAGLLNANTRKVLGQVLSGSTRSVSIINAHDKFIVEHGDHLRAINQELSGRLLQLVEQVQATVAIADALLFIVKIHELGRLDEVPELFEELHRSGKSMTVEGFEKLLEAAEDMPLSWAVNVTGGNASFESTGGKSDLSPGGSLDLARLRDFR